MSALSLMEYRRSERGASRQSVLRSRPNGSIQEFPDKLIVAEIRFSVHSAPSRISGSVTAGCGPAKKHLSPDPIQDFGISRPQFLFEVAERNAEEVSFVQCQSSIALGQLPQKAVREVLVRGGG